MAIRVVCPNGHALKVDESSAGKSGLCPVCKVPVPVPPKKAVAMTEDSLMDLLGPQEGILRPVPGSGRSEHATSARRGPVSRRP